MILLKNVLVPTDFSEHSEKSVRYGSELAAKFGATLHLLHVVEVTPIMYGEGGAFHSPDTTADMLAVAERQLNDVKIDFVDDSQVKRKIIQGHPFLEILQYAKKNEIDLIVVGTHGRGAIAHMLLGSVTEKVVRKASCPVLVVRSEEHDFVMP